MAVAELSAGIDSLRGKLSKKSDLQMRYKKYRDDRGRVIGVGPQEFFSRQSRDYKRCPRTAAEAAQAQIWREVCGEASAIAKDKTHPRYAELRERWNAQFASGGDKELNEGKDEKKVYGMFPVFVRMVLMHEKRKQQ